MRNTVHVTSFYLAVAVLASALLEPQAHALSEAQLATRSQGQIIAAMKSIRSLALNQQVHELKSKFSKSGVAALDALWDHREDWMTAPSISGFARGTCTVLIAECRTVSVFRGKQSQYPVVLLPGFTAYRKLYIEQIYDLIQAGYGPIVISDFEGTGDSFKPELRLGESLPSVGEFLSQYPDKVSDNFEDRVIQVIGQSSSAQVSSLLKQLPLGIGYVPKFSDYEKDVDVVLNKAVLESSGKPIMVVSLSMSGLNLLRSLATQNRAPTWITHVGRIVLESPMVRLLAANVGVSGIKLAIGGLESEAARAKAIFEGNQEAFSAVTGVPEFVDKATAHFNAQNIITHSANRITMTDSMRVWNGHETVGATNSWIYQALANGYSVDPWIDTDEFWIIKLKKFGSMREHRLNDLTSDIAQALHRNNIEMVVVGSYADQLVDTRSTEKLLQELTSKNSAPLYFCSFQTAKHVLDQESDRYREPYMAMLIDQQKHLLKARYGAEPRNETLNCHHVALDD